MNTERFFLNQILWIAVLIMGSVFWSPAFAADKIVLHLDFVPGESTVPRYEGDIDILAFTEGVSNSGTFSIGSGGGAGKANFSDLQVTKEIDKSSVILRSYAASGKQIPTGKLVVLEGEDKAQIEKFTINFENILITSIGGTSSNNGVVENVSIKFAKIQWNYIPASDGGSLGAAISAGWDLQQNVAH